MIRGFVIFAALCTLLVSEPHAETDRGSPRLFGHMVTFKNWPPQREGAVLIRSKRENARFRHTDSLARFQT